jgi:hypothetical protein
MASESKGRLAKFIRSSRFQKDISASGSLLGCGLLNCHPRRIDDKFVKSNFCITNVILLLYRRQGSVFGSGSDTPSEEKPAASLLKLQREMIAPQLLSASSDVRRFSYVGDMETV